MKILCKSATAILIICGLTRADGGPFASPDFDKACKQAQADQKIVFIDFYTTWCAPCKILDNTTFKDEQVIRWLTEHTVAIKVDAEKQVELAKKYRIDSYPTLVFVKPDGTEMDRIGGVIPSEAFLAEAAEILTGKDPIVRAKEKLEEAGVNNPMARMDYARKLTQLGKYEQALTEYVWCYDQGAKRDMAFVGVRDSFLLMEWAQLGRHHPPALEALRERRNAIRDRILEKGAKRKISTLASMNRFLDEPQATLELYDQVREKHPGASAIAALREQVTDALLEAKRYAEIAESKDFMAEIETEILQNGMRLSMMPEDQREKFEEFAQRSLVSRIGSYYQVLIGLERFAEAAKLATKALEVADMSETYHVLARNGLATGSPTKVNLEQARKANELAGGSDVAVIDTLARLLQAFDKQDEACDLVHKALQPLEPGTDKDWLQKCREELPCASVS